MTRSRSHRDSGRIWISALASPSRTCLLTELVARFQSPHRGSQGRVSYTSWELPAATEVQLWRLGHGLRVHIPICAHLLSAHPSRGPGLEVRKVRCIMKLKDQKTEVAGKARAGEEI